MNFSFNCIEALDCDPQTGIAILEGSYQNNILPSYSLYVNEIIDKIGLASAKYRKLQTVSTSAFKFFSSNHRIIIKANENKVLGFIKVGNKRLYLHDKNFNYFECNPLIVYDFFVYEDIRNKGIGIEIFNEMLKFEKKKVEEIAYENPSKDLIGFIFKYFGLKNYINQNNDFMVYEEFFNNIDDNLAYDNSTNRAIRALSSKVNRNNNINNNCNDDNNNINNNLRNSGHNIIFNNRFDENVINKNIYDNNSNPINAYNAFKDYYLINNNSNYYDNIYSRRKINLINDYIQSKHLDQDAYLKEQFLKKENSIQNSNNRLNNIYNNISLTNNNNNNINNINNNNNNNNNDFIFNKRNSYATVFDDKKIIENNYYNNRYNNNNNKNINFDIITNGDYLNANKNHIINGRKSPDNLQHYSPFSRYGKVYTTILPTSSSAYGNCYNVDNLNKNEQSVNRLYY